MIYNFMKPLYFYNVSIFDKVAFMDTKHAKTEQDTIAIAQELAKNITAPVLICLYGDLGAGKTVFARALIRVLNQSPDLEVPSPTFTLLQTYDSPAGDIYHYDFYRLEKPEEVFELSWEDALYDGITIAEWPERIESLLPSQRINIKFEHINETERQILISQEGEASA